MKVLRGMGYIYYLCTWGDIKKAREIERGEKQGLFYCGLDGSPTQELYYKLVDIINSNREEELDTKKYPIIVLVEDKEYKEEL